MDTKTFKFVIEVGLDRYEYIEELPADITREELDEYAEQLVWERVSVSYNEVRKD